MPDVDDEVAALVADAAALGVTLDRFRADRLLRFAGLLERWNRAFNLVSRRDMGRLYQRHLLDSLTLAPLLRGREVLDLGTGAGLPGVPLAIAREDVHFTLVDRNERRIRFVDRAVRELELGNVTARALDVRELPAQQRFDTVVCRAVASLQAVWALVRPRLTAGGRLLVMHRRESTDPVPTAPAGARLTACHRVHVPGLEQAHEIVVLEDQQGGLTGSEPGAD